MKLDKIKFLLKLLGDNDIPSNLSNKDIVDFNELEDNKYSVVVRNNEEYYKYDVFKNNDLITITKNYMDMAYSFYAIKFINVIGVYFAEVYLNHHKLYTYKLDSNFYNCDDINKIEIMDKKSADNHHGRITGKRK